MKQFKCRASQMGLLLKNDRSGKAMGETAKSYVKEWYISELTGKKKEIKSKYLERGKDLEENAIQRISKYYNEPLKKNEVFLENEFFTGTFDCSTSDRVIDAKVPLDCFTFPFFETELNPDYYAQMQIYMELTGLKKASVCYCLENGSDEQIERLSWQIAKELGKDEPDIEDWENAEKQLNYDHLPDNLRIKVFEIEYNSEFIEKAKKRVIEAIEYLQTILIN